MVQVSICARGKRNRLYLLGNAKPCESGDVKTNAGQLSILSLFRDLIEERGNEASNRTMRKSAWGVRNQPHGEPQVLAMASGEVVNLTKHFRATRVQVEQGILWITGGPEPEDVLLHEGDSMEVLGSGVFVAQALENTKLQIWS